MMRIRKPQSCVGSSSLGRTLGLPQSVWNPLREDWGTGAKCPNLPSTGFACTNWGSFWGLRPPAAAPLGLWQKQVGDLAMASPATEQLWREPLLGFLSSIRSEPDRERQRRQNFIRRDGGATSPSNTRRWASKRSELQIRVRHGSRAGVKHFWLGGNMDELLTAAFEARVRGEVDFVLAIATVRNVSWKEALAAYLDDFKRQADLVLDRAAAARERRKA
jgi:hypothetical protein